MNESTSRPIDAAAEALRTLAYRDPASFPVLLDSAAAGIHGRYSILGAYPDEELRFDVGRSGFLAAFESAWAQAAPRHAPVTADDALPFRGGWMLFVSYECAAEIEPTLQLPGAAPGEVPAALALRVPAALIYDHQQQCAWAVAEHGRDALLDRLAAAVAALPQPSAAMPAAGSMPAWHLEEEPSECFRQRVQRALDYIRAGDIYQINLSRPWRARLEPSAVATVAASGVQVASMLYERLRRCNPAPFAALLQRPGWQLLSSSPERLVRVVADQVSTRPIAGTRPRHIAGGERTEIEALVAHPKERAEHVMLIDLERNDLGRLCRAGSVRVDEFMSIESYAHVHHIVSNVQGELRSGLTPVDVLRAVFPGGTITGCPKVRCMQLIGELEGQARGAYTGALGYINHDGSMDLNILIRSLTLCGEHVELRTGAGIVADSDPQRELEETRAKARGLLLALQAASEERA